MVSLRPSAPVWTTFRRFADGLLHLASDVLLPRGASRPTLWLAVMVTAAASTALPLAALLVIGFSRGLEHLLGPPRLALAFPYLPPALAQHGSAPQIGLAAAVGSIAAGLLLGLLNRLPARLRQRWWALTGLLVLLVLSTAVDVAFTEGNGAVMEALNVRSLRGFWGTAIGLAAIYLLTLPLQFANSYGQQRFAIGWREGSTRLLGAAYLMNRNFYRLEAAEPELDNPDQRIAEDIQRSVFHATTLFFGFFASLLALGAYVLVLFGISALLVPTLLLCSLLGNGLIALLVRRLAGLDAAQQAVEADFRFGLMHLRSHAESVAFLGGEAREAQGFIQRFNRVLANLLRVARWRVLVEQSSGLYGFIMQFVPYILLSAAYFAGQVSLGQLTVGSIAFAQVQTALSFLIDRADVFSQLFASLERVRALQQATATGHPPPAPAQGKGKGHHQLRLQGLVVPHPGGGPPLITGLDLAIGAGDRVLVTGPSGCGKTSLLRVICGLSASGGGLISRPAAEAWLVLPQQPYLPLGSLRDQLLFPLAPDAIAPADDALRAILNRVRLERLADRYPDLSIEEDWGRVLSGGEQQRLGFARLLVLGRPLALLDEATSALDLSTEAELYTLLAQAGIAVISIGHRPSLRRFHQRELRLNGQGNWQLIPLPHPTSARQAHND